MIVMPAKRCSVCSLNYPVTLKYTLCLNCGEPTEYANNTKPMPPEELRALQKKHDAEHASDAELKAIREGAAERFEAIGAEAEAIAKDRGERWTAADILEEMLERQEREAA